MWSGSAPVMLKLDVLLARNLGCSRSQARRLLEAEDARGLPASLSPEQLPARLTVSGRTVELHDSFHLLLHKPTGCVTALRDLRHPTARSYLADAPLAGELRPVGRLDLDTTGLLLWTNDGAWLHRLIHPRTAVPRTYHAALARPHEPLPSDLVLRDGLRPRVLDLHPLSRQQAHPALVMPGETRAFASITIAGGAYHEVRRIFAALGSHVLGLCRVSFGTFVLPTDLAPGKWRAVDCRWEP